MIIQVNRPIWWNQTFIYTIILCICCYWQKVRPLQIFEKYIPPVGTLVECTLRLAEWYHYFLCDVHYSGRFLHIHCDAASAWRQTSPISWSGVSSPSPQRQSLSWSSIYIYMGTSLRNLCSLLQLENTKPAGISFSSSLLLPPYAPPMAPLAPPWTCSLCRPRVSGRLW